MPKRDSPDSQGQVSETGYCRNCGGALVEITGSKYVTCPNGDLGLLPMGDRGHIDMMHSELPTAIRCKTPRGEEVQFKIPGKKGLWVRDDCNTGGTQAWYKDRTVWRLYSFL